jgi:2-succinyl-6-hydroxy-2,4-cyclohexadiene-1-carboxylate synthase
MVPPAHRRKPRFGFTFSRGVDLCCVAVSDRLDRAAVKGSLWCLHGAVGQASGWRGLAVPGWGVKRVDLWRFLSCCPMTLPGFGRALNDEAVGGGRSGAEGRRVLVGYSMGARLALHALLDGGPWDAAVLVGPHPGLEDPQARAARRELDAGWAGRAMSGDWREFLRTWNEQPLFAESAEGEPAPELRRREVARSFIDWSLGAQEPLWPRLAEITCPVLWCAGERDPKFRALGERATGLLPAGELWVAPGSGHRVPWDAAEAFRAKVREFLERVIP